MTTTTLFDEIQSTDASYATFGSAEPDADQIRAGLLIRGFSNSQIDAFLARHDVLYQRPDTATGFSATVLRTTDANGTRYTLALRGTNEVLNDILDADFTQIVGFGAAVSQIVDLYNLWTGLRAPEGATVRQARVVETADPTAPGVFHRLTADRYLRVEFFDQANAGLGILAEDAIVDVTGHSLGGHLANAFERLFPSSVGTVFTVNGAGTRETSTTSAFFDALAERTGTQFNPSSYVSVFGSAGPNVVSGELVYTQLGARAKLYTEGQADAFGHGAAQMTDSAAVYDLFIRADDRLKAQTPTQMADFMFELFAASSPSARFTLESMVNSLGRIFVPAYQPLIAADQDNREALFAKISQVSVWLPQGGLTIEPLTENSEAQISTTASTSQAYRFALRYLAPFALEGADYSQFGSELALYDAATDAGLSQKWLEARARFLTKVLEYNKQDGNLSPAAIGARFEDRALGIQIGTLTQTVSQYLFGSDTVANSLIGFAQPDFLFGGAFADTISSGAGGDYIEGGAGGDSIDVGAGDDEALGGAGNDTLLGSQGNDRLLGGSGDDSLDGGSDSDVLYGDQENANSTSIVGNDTLSGGTGQDRLYGGGGNDVLIGGADNDHLEGGAGFDTYVFLSGDGSDTVFDSDGVGAISYQGRTLTGGTLIQGATYEDAQGVRYDLIDSSLLIDGKVLIQNFTNGNLGIALDGTEQPPTVPSTNPTRFYLNSQLPTDWNPNNPPFHNFDGSEASDSFINNDGAGRWFYGRGGNDVVIHTGSIFNGVELDAGSGNDLVDASGAPDVDGSFLVGGSGDDYILGTPGNDRIHGDSYNLQATVTEGGTFYEIDGFRYSYAASDPLHYTNTGNADWDRILASSGAYVNDFEAIVGPWDVATLVGFLSAQNWTFSGLDAMLDYLFPDTSFDDFIDGGAGDDLITGGSGSDRIKGGSGNDSINGDSPVTAAQISVIFGSAAVEKFGVQGDDVLDGGDGDDSIADTAGGAYMDGGSGNDVLSISGAVDGIYIVHGGEGNDKIFAQSTSASAILSGDDGNDEFFAQSASASVILSGDAGNDEFNVGLNVQADGGAGDDTFRFQSNTFSAGASGASGFIQDSGGDDTVVGLDLRKAYLGFSFDDLAPFGEGTGPDSISRTVQREGDDLVLLAVNGQATKALYFVDWFGDTSRRIEHFVDANGFDIASTLPTWGSFHIGSDLDEEFYGTEYSDEVLGFGGNDIIVTGAGNDHLAGGTGSNYLDGGDGDDIYFYAAVNGNDTIRDTSGSDRIEFAAGIASTDVSSTIGAGILTLTVGSGSISFAIDGYGTALSAPAIESLHFADGGIVSTAGLVANTVTLQGTTSGDSLVGNEQANRVVGGLGDDLLMGGAGGDVYVFGLGDGVDHISDLSQSGAVNTVEFGPGITADMLSLGLGSLLVKVGSGGDAIHLDSVNAGDLFGVHDIDRFVFNDGSELSYTALLERGIDILGTDEDDVLVGSNITDRIRGGLGTDLLVGGAGDDVYEFNLGDGQDTIQDTDPAAGNTDTLEFGAGISADGIVAERTQDDLSLWIEGTSDRVSIRWNPAVGSAIESVRFNDGTVWDYAFLQQLVGSGTNTAPVVANPIADHAATEDAAFSFTVSANTFTDLDVGDTLTYSATSADGTVLPSWLGFDPTTQAFGGTPINANVGFIDVKVTATDSANASVSDVFRVTVVNTNDAPAVANLISDQTATEDAAFSFTMPANTFADVDVGDALTYSATLSNGAALPSWLDFNPTTRTFSGTPLNANVGLIDVKVTATDNANASVSDIFRVTAVNTNDAPTVVNLILDQTATEDAAFSFTVPVNTFADVDVGDTRSFGATLSNGTALPTWLTFDAATRTLSGTPGAGDTGNLQIRVTATDQGGLSASDNFALNVAAAATNVITGTTGADTLIGTDGVDLISGLDGGDIILGNGGNDTIVGGAGDDNLDGGAGDDTFLVQASDDGNDGVEGGEGFDQILGGSGDDVIGLWDHQGTRSVERIDGGAGVNIISGTASSDTLDFSGTTLVNIARIEGGDSGDIIVGSAGNDTIVGGAGDDNLDGGAGDDTFLVQGSDDGNDGVEGGEGFDQILGGSGDDVIGLWDHQGTRSVERIDGGEGVNIISGTAGSDTLDFSGTTLVNIARIEGGDGADRIVGSAGDDTLDGGGDDNDILAGGTGNDTYLLSRGYGADDIEDEDSTTGNTDIGQFLAGVSRDQIWLQQTGDDLVASIIGTSDRFTVRNWYLGSENHLEQFRTADGSMLLESNVQNLVNAMAAFAPPAPGQETLPSDYATALNPVIAANWQ